MRKGALEPPYSRKTTKYAKQKEQEVSKLEIREHFQNDVPRKRNVSHQDYGRVLYSSSFRRLQGKMQLLGIDQTHFFRNRLTHSLEVCQISKGIASRAGLANTLVAETCSLAHDIGNPPFGHYGEEILNDLTKKIGGYEGNAQTLRILRQLEQKHHKYSGLNLTLRTLMGVIKYDRKRSDPSTPKERSKFLYNDDYEAIHRKVRDNGAPFEKIDTIDKQVMDLADEIAYAAHDLEDSLKSDYFTIDELLHEFKNSDEYREGHELLSKVVRTCRTFGSRAVGEDNTEKYSVLFRKELTSRIVNELVKNIEVQDTPTGQRLGYKDSYWALAEGLKKLIFKEILTKPNVLLYEQRGRKVIEGLYAVYCDESFNKNLNLLPPEYRKVENDAEKQRRVADYIGGMMDSFAEQEFIRYYGEEEYIKLYPSDRFQSSTKLIEKPQSLLLGKRREAIRALRKRSPK